jgi:polygalacturonase
MLDLTANRRDLLKLATLGLTATAVPAAHALSQSVAHGSAASFFDVRAYGGVGDGKTVDSPAFNRAIDAASAAGGGTVLVPAGVYLCFSIRLKSYVHLHLAPGATILAADSPLPGETTGYNGGTYDAAESNAPWEAYQDYGHNHWHNSLIWGENIHDCSITGPGLIHGKGLSNGRGRDNDGALFTAEQPGVGNKAIALKNCHNVIFRDFSILKGGHFGLLLTGVDNLSIDNLKIDTDRDGIDIDCCKNVRVSNCTVNSPWDDGICPKSSFALGYSRATENVTITNCYVTGCFELGSLLDGSFKKLAPDSKVPRTGRIKCGTESNGGFRNITIANCVFEGCQGLALESVDGALLEDITISNITMRDIVSSPIFMRLGARLRGPRGAGDQATTVGTLRRVLINNLVCYNSGARVCSTISGIPGHAIEDVKFANIYLEYRGDASPDTGKLIPPEFESKYPEPGMFGDMPAQGFYIRHLRNLEMSHVDVHPMSPDPRPAFYLEDVHRADFIAVTAPTQNPAFFFNKVTDLRILLSRAAKDTRLDAADQLFL